MTVLEISGSRVLLLDAEGPAVADAGDLIGDAWSEEASIVAIPAPRLDPRFFELRSGVAGEIAQKLVNYRIRLVVLGDVAAERAASDALDAYVWESNRGEQVWFLDDVASLEARLAGR